MFYNNKNIINNNLNNKINSLVTNNIELEIISKDKKEEKMFLLENSYFNKNLIVKSAIKDTLNKTQNKKNKEVKFKFKL